MVAHCGRAAPCDFGASPCIHSPLRNSVSCCFTSCEAICTRTTDLDSQNIHLFGALLRCALFLWLGTLANNARTFPLHPARQASCWHPRDPTMHTAMRIYVLLTAYDAIPVSYTHLRVSCLQWIISQH